MPASATGIKGLHVVRYGIPAEHKFLLGEFLSTYDQLVFNATIVAYMPAAIASFIGQRASRKPYFIDPLTHAFQHDVTILSKGPSESDGGEVKRSLQALARAYGEPIESRIKRGRVLLPSDLKDKRVRLPFCERVVEFQNSALAEVFEKSDAAKYYKYLAKKGKAGTQPTRPGLVIAPYFFLTPSTLSLWLDVNLKCAADSFMKASGLGFPLGVQVVISRDLLSNTSLRSKLVQAYASLKEVNVFLLWIDEFPEQRADQLELEALADLINGLGKRAPVVNLYGGFFSVAIARCGVTSRLIGVAHGLEYGEDRPVVPVGGGIPTAKFYLPSLHVRLAFRVAVRAIRQLSGFTGAADFHKKVCGCAECRRVIDGNPEADFAAYGRTRSVTFSRRGQPVTREFPISETRESSVQHYMWCKQREYRDVTSLTAIIRDLQDAYRELSKTLGLDNTAHCKVWADILLNLSHQK